MSQSLFKLPVEEQLTPFISLRQQDQLPLIIITHPTFQAAVALQGAQLISWQPMTEEPVIWLSENTDFYPGKAIRGGVPVCWPWFGTQGKPAHGFARTQTWDLLAHDEDDNKVSLTFELKDNKQTRKLWPHSFSLILKLWITRQQCDLELEAWGDFESTTALHSYFTVSDSRKVRVFGLGDSYIDQVLANQLGHLLGPQTYPDRIDRIFTAPEACSRIEDEQFNRQIEIHHQYHSDVVTWNPGQALSLSMNDMTNEGFQNMVCVETARINQPLISQCNEPARLAVTFRIAKASN